MQIFKKLKARWDIESNWQIIIILFVFSLTGFTALFARRFIFPLLGIEASDPFWYKTIMWLITIFPIYNILLLTYAALFGQFKFFWRFFKKMMGRFVPNK
ncbi:MAG: prolipoprotein diacylglyceryl transferase [Gracilimonas sp.]|uniref:DUF6787 family protein n=1 Tax=Gracilimonas sp. TaxID=1974203 RepID=UPI001996A479|nr:DUF6787 family protein [Gracilimonas sp.]MBD3617265.1 prolipoprotein diacylglyceryl transferase [Gracilimonas sp.]